MLALPEEAIRRDIHFVARHPTRSSSAWGTACWWYDCPEAARHATRIRVRRQTHLPGRAGDANMGTRGGNLSGFVSCTEPF